MLLIVRLAAANCGALIKSKHRGRHRISTTSPTRGTRVTCHVDTACCVTNCRQSGCNISQIRTPDVSIKVPLVLIINSCNSPAEKYLLCSLFLCECEGRRTHDYIRSYYFNAQKQWRYEWKSFATFLLASLQAME